MIPDMRASFICLTVALTLTFGHAAFATDSSQWPSAPSRLSLDTPYGNLHVSASDYVYESLLKLDEEEIEPQIKGLLNIPYAFSSPDFHIALISIDTGDKTCPVSYKWITLKSTGYSVTPKFGSCSDQIKVTAEGTTFSLQTPNTEDPDKIDHYLYDGETLSYQ